ncbi:MAG: methyltransferase domain-containing protein, partial [Geminicoccaceae bacterium]
MTWSPERYLAFADHRTRPAIELLARVALKTPSRVVDLGCGPGNATALLAARWPKAEITGVDSSPEMLGKARASGLRATWELADIADWAPEQPCDLLYTNAALQWLPDHARLVPRLFEQVRPGGALAVQMPRYFDAPSHV